MVNQNSPPIFNSSLNEGAMEYFVTQAKSYLGRGSWAALSCIGGQPDELEGLLNSRKGRFYRLLAFWVSMEGLFPNEFEEALEKGYVYLLEDDEDIMPWAGKYGLNLKALSTEELLSIKAIENKNFMNFSIPTQILVSEKFAKSRSEEIKALYTTLEELGIPIYTEDMLIQKHLEGLSISEKSVIAYLENLGAKKKEGDDWISYKFSDYITLELKCQGNSWYYREGLTEHQFRNSYTLSGHLATPGMIVLWSLGYLLGASEYKDLKGRRAYLADVFVDKVNVGFTHEVLNEALVNKVGVLEGRVSPKNHQVRIFKGSDLLAAAQALERAGTSVFMHKSAKYLIAPAGACGLSRVGGKTQSMTFVDKPQKATALVLNLVPTALESIGRKTSLENID